MDFFAQGILEVVNLSGRGCEGLDQTESSGPDSLAKLVADLDKAGDLGLKPPAGADLAADLTCLKTQLTRSQPLLKVVKACLLAVEAALVQSPTPQAEALARRAAGLLG
jgi:hypothetical protein